VVDDEASICEITRLTLQSFGFEVLTALDGTEAVAQYAAHGHEIALVITDMMMPIMDGPRTIRALRKLNPNVKIIAASGLQGNEPNSRERGLQVQAFLAKPYTAERLLATIHQVLFPDP